MIFQRGHEYTYTPTKFIFVRYYKYTKGYSLPQLNSNEIIIRRNVKCSPILSTNKPNLLFVPYLDYKSYSMFMSFSLPKFSIGNPTSVPSSNDESEVKNALIRTHFHLLGHI